MEVFIKKYILLLSTFFLFSNIDAGNNCSISKNDNSIKYANASLPSNIHQTRIETLDSYANKKIAKNEKEGPVYSAPTYWSGACTNYYDYYITSIKKINGVYSHFGSYASKSILSSGQYYREYKSTFEYFTCTEETIYFKYSESVNLESSLYLSFGIGDGGLDAGGGMKAEIDESMTYEHSYYYTTKTAQSVKMSKSFVLNENTCNFCPDGFAITVGIKCTYYVIDLYARNVVNTWFGKKKDSFALKPIVIADEGSFVETYVFIDDNGNTYYDL